MTDQRTTEAGGGGAVMRNLGTVNTFCGNDGNCLESSCHLHIHFFSLDLLEFVEHVK